MSPERDRPSTTEDAIRRAHQILADSGIELSSTKVIRLARDFVRADPPCTFATYISRNAVARPIAQEAAGWPRRRGDLIRVRQKRRRPPRTSTGMSAA